MKTYDDISEALLYGGSGCEYNLIIDKEVKRTTKELILKEIRGLNVEDAIISHLGVFPLEKAGKRALYWCLSVIKDFYFSEV